MFSNVTFSRHINYALKLKNTYNWYEKLSSVYNEKNLLKIKKLWDYYFEAIIINKMFITVRIMFFKRYKN